MTKEEWAELANLFEALSKEIEKRELLKAAEAADREAREAPNSGGGRNF